jgi:hypothetical protein
MRRLSELERAPESRRAGRQAPPVGGAAPNAGRSGPARPASEWGPRQRVLVVGAVITVLGLGMAGYFYLFRPRIPAAERMAPIDTWGLWHDLSQGLDQRPVWELQYLEGRAYYRRWMAVAGVVIAAGLLVTGGSLLIPRGRRRTRPRRRPLPQPRSPAPKQP